MKAQKYIIFILLSGFLIYFLDAGQSGPEQEGVFSAQEHDGSDRSQDYEDQYSELAGAMKLLGLDFKTELQKMRETLDIPQLRAEHSAAFEKLHVDINSMPEILTCMPVSEFINKYDQFVVEEFLDQMKKSFLLEIGKSFAFSDFFIYMTQEENVDYFKNILQQKIVKLDKAPSYFSLLELAIIRQEVWLVRFLIQLEIDINRINARGKNSLQMAQEKKIIAQESGQQEHLFDEIIDLLKKAGARDVPMRSQESSSTCVIM